MNLSTEYFKVIKLNGENQIFATLHPQKFSTLSFQELWDMHPAEYHTLKMHGREVKTPRWQQAYGKDYRYTGARNNALPIPGVLKPYIDWCREHIDERLNALLLNWYDGQKNHYIGAHRDDQRDLVEGSPIVTISQGEARVFRMRPYKKEGFQDVLMEDGDVIVIPWETNKSWTHEVPKFSKYQGKRISITLRVFED